MHYSTRTEEPASLSLSDRCVYSSLSLSDMTGRWCVWRFEVVGGGGKGRRVVERVKREVGEVL
jgi:hypothetical protein